MLKVKPLEPGAPLDLAQARNAVELARLAGRRSLRRRDVRQGDAAARGGGDGAREAAEAATQCSSRRGRRRRPPKTPG